LSVQPERRILTPKNTCSIWITVERTMPLGAKNIRELAERIDATAAGFKSSDEHESRFIRPWRLNDHSRQETKEVISCSAGECGCGISPDLK
jgi:hypothetical protein